MVCMAAFGIECTCKRSTHTHTPTHVHTHTRDLGHVENTTRRTGQELPRVAAYGKETQYQENEAYFALDTLLNFAPYAHTTFSKY